jgi:serine/threonine protein kinase/tetratricopeptide (TPR) repeat protein
MIGQTISHYKILEKLGEGGMGIVYKAQDTKLDRLVALKFLPNFLTNDSNEKERFQQEARAAAALTHQNVAVIYEIGENEGSQGGKLMFLAMEYVEGRTLKAFIEHDGESLSVKKVLDIAIQASEGLSAAHEKGIVHRDIKSDNIMVNPKGQVKIMDFGLAKVKGATKYTQAGSTVGTAAYMSPEQAQGEDVDPRSDIFSFGVVLYEMLTTHLPFRGEHQAALVYSLINEDPQPIARFNEKVSPDLERIVTKALSKDKDERYQHVDDMLADLRRERKNLEYARTGYFKAPTVQQGTPPVQPKPKKTIPWKIVIPSALVVMAAILLAVLIPFKLEVLENRASATPGNSLAVMYFENIPHPADPDHTGEMLTNLLITSLSQVKGLEVISRERLQEIQKDLGGTDTKNLTPSLAGQVAKRAGVSTMLIGSILQEKPDLAVTTRLIDVQSGKILGSQQVTNFTSSQIFALVDSLASAIHNTLQPATTTPTEIKSVADVTTKSPEAYRAYMAGLELYDKLYITEASAAFSRAIEFDKNFAMAYYYLSVVQGFYGTTEASHRSLNRAVELADKTTERERLQILSSEYFQQNNLPKAIQANDELIARYPHELNPYVVQGWVVYGKTMLDPERGSEVLRRGLKVEPSAKTLWNVLAYSLANLNRRNDAFDAANKYVNLAPAEPNPYDTFGDIYAWFGEYDSSRALYQKAISLREDFSSNAKLGAFALLRNQYGLADRYFQACNFGLPLTDLHRGQIQNAEKKFSVLPASQIPESDKLRAMINLSYESGQYPEMLRLSRQLSAQLKKDPTNIIFGRDYLSWALAKNGKSTEAHTVLNGLMNDVRGKAPMFEVTADYASALVALEEGNDGLSLETFRKAFQTLPPNHEPNLFFGIALLKTGQISEAIAEFQRLQYWPQYNDLYLLQGLPGTDLDWPVPEVKAHYWLGVAYEKQDEKEKALDKYRKFLEIWKDTDFVSPEITDAKARVNALKGSALQ